MVQDAAVRDEHDDDGQQVDGQVEEESVGNVQPMVRDVLTADVDDMQRQSIVVIHRVVENRFKALNSDLRRHEDEGQNPEDAD